MDVSNITLDQHDEPIVVIKLTGYHEIYRFAHHMETGQVEFGAAGNKIIRRIRRRFTADQWDEWMWTLHGDKGRRYHPASKPRPAPPRPERHRLGTGRSALRDERMRPVWLSRMA